MTEEEIVKIIQEQMKIADRNSVEALNKWDMDVHRYYAGQYHALQNLYYEIQRH